jgi:hypothetical protein
MRVSSAFATFTVENVSHGISLVVRERNAQLGLGVESENRVPTRGSDHRCANNWKAENAGIIVNPGCERNRDFSPTMSRNASGRGAVLLVGLRRLR